MTGTPRIPAAEVTGVYGHLIKVAVRAFIGTVPESLGVAAAISVDVEAGRITRFYVVLNPEKLERLDAEAALAR